MYKSNNLSDFCETNNQNGITAIIGLSKNAGKTTMLNWLLSMYQGSPVAVFTTGRDGEETDLVEGKAKPKVFIPPDCYFTTFAEELARQSTKITVLEKLNMKAGGKYLWLAKSNSRLQTEIVGPATVLQQEKLLTILKKNYNITKIFIDGSLDRKSIVLSANVSSIVLVVSPVFGSKENILSEVLRLQQLGNLQVDHAIIQTANICYNLDDKIIPTPFTSLFGNEKEIAAILELNPESLYLPGAFTDRSYQTLSHTWKKFTGTLLLKHPLQLQLSSQNLDHFLKSVQVSVQNHFSLSALGINSYAQNGKHLDCDELRNYLRANLKNLTIIDVTEI